MTEKELMALDKQVTWLEDVQEIENLQKLYGYFFDNQMYAEVLDLFSEKTESVEVTDHGVLSGEKRRDTDV